MDLHDPKQSRADRKKDPKAFDVARDPRLQKTEPKQPPEKPKQPETISLDTPENLAFNKRREEENKKSRGAAVKKGVGIGLAVGTLAIGGGAAARPDPTPSHRPAGDRIRGPKRSPEANHRYHLG